MPEGHVDQLLDTLKTKTSAKFTLIILIKVDTQLMHQYIR